MRGIKEVGLLNLKLYTALKIQAEEKELRMRPDYILMEKEMKKDPEYIKLEKKRYEEQQERYHKLWREINGLSRLKKAFFVMHCDMGISTKQLAEDFKVPEVTVKTYIQRAKKELQKKLVDINPANRKRH